MLHIHQSSSPNCRPATTRTASSSLGRDVADKLAHATNSGQVASADQSAFARAVKEKLAGKDRTSRPTFEPDTDEHNGMDIDPGIPDAGADLPVRDDMEIDLDAQVGAGRTGADKPEDNPLGWGSSDEARARRMGRSARTAEDLVFDEEEEEEEEMERVDAIRVGGPERDLDEESGLGNANDRGGEGAGGGGGGSDEHGSDDEDDGDGGGGGGGDGGGGGGGDDDDNEPMPRPPPPPGNRRIQPFGGRAGETLNGGAAARDGFEKYESKLPDVQNPNNIYHPFDSKMDWEIAAWASTYGIGSNALTALLSIEGVSARFTHYITFIVLIVVSLAHRRSRYAVSQ